jgi:hypothetical protein
MQPKLVFVSFLQFSFCKDHNFGVLVAIMCFRSCWLVKDASDIEGYDFK